MPSAGRKRRSGNRATFHDITATATSAPVLPIPLLRAEFSLPVRDIAAAEETGNLISLAQVAIAAIAAARLEDQLIFHGNREVGDRRPAERAGRGAS